MPRASGDLLGMSVGFMSVRQEWDYLDWDDWDPDLGPDHKDKVTRLEARLLEVSLTPTPVFEAAEVQCVRTASRHRGPVGGRPVLPCPPGRCLARGRGPVTLRP